MDKNIIFEKAEKEKNEIMYLPDDTHENFEVYANVEPKEKCTYSYVNKDGYLVGKFMGMIPNLAAKKVLRRIHMYCKIRNPIFYIYNHNKHMLYKYAGLVEPINKKKDRIINIEIENGEQLIINKKYDYTVRQIEKKQF